MLLGGGLGAAYLRDGDSAADKLIGAGKGVAIGGGVAVAPLLAEEARASAYALRMAAKAGRFREFAAPLASAYGTYAGGLAVPVGLTAAGLYGAGKMMNRQKTASLKEYSVLFDKVASGDLGESARQALLGICDTIPEPDTLSEKTASVYDGGMVTSESDARNNRLDQLLRR
jgi:hypothetical protein